MSLKTLKTLMSYSRVFISPKSPHMRGGVMFYDADYPDAINLGFRETDSLGVFIFVLPTP